MAAFVSSLLLAVLTAHLFGVGTLVYAGNGECLESCNLRQGYCTPEGSCRCYPGWEGKNCNQCSKGVGCLHGTCHQPWQCNCEDGWGGPRCDKDLKVCERTQPCENHATCINNGNGGYLCVCHPGFYGITCEHYSPDGIPDLSDDAPTTPAIKTPPPKLCKNGGRCRVYGTKRDCERCICQPGYVGKYCEVNVNECLMRPCANGGKCFDLSNDFYCECESGFTGRYCSSDIDECSLSSDLCFNGGTCKNTFGSYECTCPEGYSGPRCGISERSSTERPKAFIPRIVKLSTAQTKSTTVTPKTAKNDKKAQEKKPKPQIINVPEDEVKMTRITHELKISSVNGEYVPQNNELYIRQDLKENAGADSSAQAMQAMTFVFMGLAIVILAAILALVWVRCFRHSNGDAKKSQDSSECEAPPTPSVISSVDKDVQSNRISRYEPVSLKDISDLAMNQVLEMAPAQASAVTIEDDASYMQIQPRTRPTTQQQHRSRPVSTHYEANLPSRSCPSPPPPYLANPTEARVVTGIQRPTSGYYVALPPVTSSRPSHLNIANAPCRKSRRASLSSEDPEEVTSLLEAGSPDSSTTHRILV